MVSFPILAVGFFMGMRHATDPEHVIAVTTIVSNQRNNCGRWYRQGRRFNEIRISSERFHRSVGLGIWKTREPTRPCVAGSESATHYEFCDCDSLSAISSAVFLPV